ncbi:MFS transporter [Solihabitans fulvus]|uniref:MFS transporter n=1 Tax=Solihabitans fulvus TaxID=1892852 RepID=UPI0016620E1B|nr:MFS transporter [Solihabitans fulvus]
MPEAATLGAPLAVREFRAIWLAELQSLIGDQLATVALAVLVYQRTGSPLFSALTFVAITLPALAGVFGLGALADRYPRHLVLVTCAVLQAALLAVMAVPSVPWGALLGLLVVVQLVQCPFLAAQNATVRVAVPGDLLEPAMTWRQINLSTGSLLGLVGGGLVVAAIGPRWALALDAATFAVTALVLRFGVLARPTPVRPAEHAGERQPSWSAGFRLMFGTAELRALMLFVWLTAVPFAGFALLVPFAAEVGGSPRAVGWLLAAGPLGWLLVTFALARIEAVTGRRWDRMRWLPSLVIVMMVPLIGFAVTKSTVVAAVLIGVSGACEVGTPAAQAALTRLIPDHLMGAGYSVARSGLRVTQALAAAGAGLAAQLSHTAGGTIAAIGVFGVLVAVPVAVAVRRARFAVAEVSNQ